MDADNSSSSSSSSNWKSRLKAAGQSLQESGRDESDSAASDRITPVSYKRGGKTRKTGMALLHKGERVIPRGKVKKVEKMMRKKKMRMKDRG